MIDRLLSLISPKITVDVSPESFTFTSAKGTLSLGTYLYLSNLNGEGKILGIGETFEGSEECIRVDLFKRSATRSVDQFGCLAAFFRFAFKKLSSRMALVRPIAIIKSWESLDEALCGYQRLILEQAATTAGAHTVKFL